MGEYVGVKRLDVFINYALYRLRERQQDDLYKAYMSDHIKALTGSKTRWIELIKPPKKIDADKVAADIINRAGLVIS